MSSFVSFPPTDGEPLSHLFENLKKQRVKEQTEDYRQRGNRKSDQVPGEGKRMSLEPRVLSLSVPYTPHIWNDHIKL